MSEVLFGKEDLSDQVKHKQLEISTFLLFFCYVKCAYLCEVSSNPPCVTVWMSCSQFQLLEVPERSAYIDTASNRDVMNDFTFASATVCQQRKIVRKESTTSNQFMHILRKKGTVLGYSCVLLYVLFDEVLTKNLLVFHPERSDLCTCPESDYN